jgi:DNA-directed RNA polymerase subunit M
MDMKFCPKCDSVMLPKKVGDGLILTCSGCGHIIKDVESGEYRLVKKFEQKDEKVEIVEEEPSTLPTVNIRCESCGNSKAYWWLRQTRGADEPTTRFLRCTKCSHTWREYT